VGEKKNTLSAKERFEIAVLLRQHCHYVDGREGTVIYEEGWSDEKVAAEVAATTGNPEVNHRHVGRIRRDAMGELLSAQGGWQRGRLQELIANFNELCDRLDARDLKL
jgi:hypothetical protein